MLWKRFTQLAQPAVEVKLCRRPAVDFTRQSDHTAGQQVNGESRTLRTRWITFHSIFHVVWLDHRPIVRAEVDGDDEHLVQKTELHLVLLIVQDFPVQVPRHINENLLRDFNITMTPVGFQLRRRKMDPFRNFEPSHLWFIVWHSFQDSQGTFWQSKADASETPKIALVGLGPIASFHHTDSVTTCETVSNTAAETFVKMLKGETGSARRGLGHKDSDIWVDEGVAVGSCGINRLFFFGLFGAANIFSTGSSTFTCRFSAACDQAG